jgi:2-methylisocitrate lyase-like PEP mutase family enzyme
MGLIMTATARRRQLRNQLAGSEPVVAPGVYDCLTAKLVEEAGFQAVAVTGAGVAASVLGVPDVGLVTMTESLTQTRNITRAIEIPVVADCDTGYGNPVNAQRTVREYEDAGVAALFIEDQVFPKRCGHFAGKQVISQEEMAQKIRAAVDARRDPELVLIARTDARAVEGLDGALSRARAYVDAGADMIFVEAPQSADELARVAAGLAPLRVPLMVNLVEGGKTPLIPVPELGKLGFRLVTYSGSLQKTAIASMRGFLESLRNDGDVGAYYPSKMVSLEDRSKLLALPHFFELEQRYASSE